MSSTSTRPGADDLASLAVRGVSRRTIARTTAWATPVLLTTVGAPAFAGSGTCVDRGTAVLTPCSDGGDDSGDDGGGDGGHDSRTGNHTAATTSSGKDDDNNDDCGSDGGSSDDHHDTGSHLAAGTAGSGSGHDDNDDDTCCPPVSSLTFGASTITATVDIAATDAGGKAITMASDTGVVRQTTSSPSWSYINLHHPAGMSQGDTLTMTITLSRAVANFTLRITDIDKDPGSWIDEVFVSTPGYAFTAGSNVGGSGAAKDPFIAKGDGRIDDTDEADSGDVTLLWKGLVQQVTIRYVAADKKNDSGIGQHIGVGQIGFDNCA